MPRYASVSDSGCIFFQPSLEKKGFQYSPWRKFSTAPFMNKIYITGLKIRRYNTSRRKTLFYTNKLQRNQHYHIIIFINKIPFLLPGCCWTKLSSSNTYVRWQQEKMTRKSGKIKKENPAGWTGDGNRWKRNIRKRWVKNK